MEDMNYAFIFKVLSDETRLKICEIISAGEICACDILERLDISQSTLSYHMKLLCEAKITTCRKQCQWTRYQLNEEQIKLLICYLSCMHCKNNK